MTPARIAKQIGAKESAQYTFTFTHVCLKQAQPFVQVICILFDGSHAAVRAAGQSLRRKTRHIYVHQLPTASRAFSTACSHAQPCKRGLLHHRTHRRGTKTSLRPRHSAAEPPHSNAIQSIVYCARKKPHSVLAHCVRLPVVPLLPFECCAAARPRRLNF